MSPSHILKGGNNREMKLSSKTFHPSNKSFKLSTNENKKNGGNHNEEGRDLYVQPFFFFKFPIGIFK